MSADREVGADDFGVALETVHPEAGGPDFDALINAYADARVRREKAGELMKELQRYEDEAEEALFSSMEAMNLRSIRHERGLFSLNDLADARVVDEVKAREWAQLYLSEVITLNRQRLSKVVRDLLRGDEAPGPLVHNGEFGVDLPPGVDIAFRRTIGWRRG